MMWDATVGTGLFICHCSDSVLCLRKVILLVCDPLDRLEPWRDEKPPWAVKKNCCACSQHVEQEPITIPFPSRWCHICGGSEPWSVDISWYRRSWAGSILKYSKFLWSIPSQSKEKALYWKHCRFMSLLTAGAFGTAKKWACLSWIVAKMG